MYKLDIVNEVNGRTFGSTWSDKAEKDAYLEKLIAKNSWGRPQRKMLRSDVPAELEDRIIKIESVTTYEIDEQGSEIEVSVEHATLKADYVITETNLNLSKTYRNQKKIEARKKEYPSIEEVLHILLDHGVDSEQYAALQAERAAIKLKHALEK